MCVLHAQRMFTGCEQGIVTKREQNLYHRALDHLYKYAYFNYNGKGIKHYEDSQIQGSKSGGDNTSLFMRVYLCINET